MQPILYQPQAAARASAGLGLVQIADRRICDAVSAMRSLNEQVPLGMLDAFRSEVCDAKALAALICGAEFVAEVPAQT
jgi:hypothetical protein